MIFSIDTTSRNKAAAYPVEHGFVLRTGAPTSIIVHDTEGVVGQSLDSAARYLYTTALVSAHYLIGRGGEIIQFLDPRKYAAWHAGMALIPYQNQHSIGIELLHAAGEPWMPIQKSALAWLLQKLMADYPIPLTSIDTHGQVALPGPYSRKKDPTGWPRTDFLVWRNALVVQPPTFPTLFKTTRPTPIYQDSAATLPIGTAVAGTLLLIDGARYATPTGHISKTSMNFPDLGFVKLSDLTEVK